MCTSSFASPARFAGRLMLVFAVLGLRAMYFLLADALRRFELLKYALALILIFVGLKMTWLNNLYDGKFPVEWSLGIIAALLVGAVIASIIGGSRERRPHVHET